MPFLTPPAIVQPVQAQTPLVSEMIKRAAEQYPLETGNTPTTVPDSSPDMATKMGEFAPLLGGAADVITTQMGLGRGGREANPLLPQNRLGNGLMLGGSYLGAALLSKLLADHGHEGLAKLLGYGGGAIGAASAIHNIGTIKNLR